MKISEILYKEFKHAPTRDEFDEFIDKSSLSLEVKYSLIMKHKNRIKKPVELGMLVPCKDGKVLEEPKVDTTICCDAVESPNKGWCPTCDRPSKGKYQKAKEDVIFSGYSYTNTNKNQIYIIGNGKNRVYFNTDMGCFYVDGYNYNKISDLTGQPITQHYFKFLD